MSTQTESVIELREVSISKSNQRDQSRTAWSLYLEKQISVSLLQRHSQYNDLLTLIALLISESIRLLIHVQLVSLLQWHDNVFDNKQIFELVSISKLSVSLLQRHRQCNDLLIALSISESIYLEFLCQLVSLLQWHVR